MLNRSISQLFPVLAVLLCCPMTAPAQALRTTPVSSVISREDSVVKIAPTLRLQKASGTNYSVLPITASGLVRLAGISYDRYRILDSQGELWVAGPGTRDQTIDLGHLPTGIYYLHLSTTEGEFVNKVLWGSHASRE